MKTMILILLSIIFYTSGCTSIQEEYKPLYQVEPQKVELKADEK